MYLARFAAGNTEIVTAAFTWTTQARTLLPHSWYRKIAELANVDVALRISTGSAENHAVLLLSTDTTMEGELRAICETLLQKEKPPDLVVPTVPHEFDATTGGLPLNQLRVNYEGYHHQGLPLACDFRLYPIFSSQCQTLSARFQVHLRAHRPDSETERRVRKHIAWLDVEEPFSQPVREMQRVLARRMLNRGWVGQEYLLLDSAESLERWLGLIRTHFNETTGRIGFPEAPLETGDFTDWLVTGYHSARDADRPPSLPYQAATIFSQEEFRFLMTADFAQSADTTTSTLGSRPDVFISYASSDFSHASATCHHLEQNGVVCWIAPRDINRDLLPYTEAIQLALSRVRTVIVLLSESANLSVHIPRELDLALERKLPIVPIRLHEVLPAGQLNYLLRTCQRLDAFARDFDSVMGELLTRLSSLRPAK